VVFLRFLKFTDKSTTRFTRVCRQWFGEGKVQWLNTVDNKTSCKTLYDLLTTSKASAWPSKIRATSEGKFKLIQE